MPPFIFLLPCIVPIDIELNRTGYNKWNGIHFYAHNPALVESVPVNRDGCETMSLKSIHRIMMNNPDLTKQRTK